MLYFFIKIISWIVFKCFFGLHIAGNENIPANGPFIVVANHSSVLDGFVLSASIQPKITFLVAANLFEMSFYGAILRGIGAIPVKRNGSDIQALKKSLRILKQGGILGVFPEGRITEKENDFTAKAGAAYLAMKTEVPIIPIAIQGTDKALPVGKKWPKFNKIEVHIGKIIETSKIMRENKKDFYKLVDGYLKEIH